MKKVLLIGKNSYIGNSFIADFSNKYKIDTFDSIYPLNVETYKGYDTVIHLAGIAHVPSRKSKSLDDLYMRVNRDLAIESCKLAKEGNVKQFIFMSSMIIYGNDLRIGKPYEITDKTTPNPANSYGRSKLEADLFIQSQNGDEFKTLVIRTPMVYGEGCKGNFPKLLKLADKLPIIPKIHNKRSVIEIHNLTKFFKDSIDNESSGVKYPQDDHYMDTTEVIRDYRMSKGKKTFESTLLALLVKFASIFIGSFKKTYGTKIYLKDSHK